MSQFGYKRCEIAQKKKRHSVEIEKESEVARKIRNLYVTKCKPVQISNVAKDHVPKRFICDVDVRCVVAKCLFEKEIVHELDIWLIYHGQYIQ